MNIPTPYLVFIGDAADYKQAKVAFGVSEWRPELCTGQISLTGCKVDLGLPDQSIDQAVASGAKTFLIGISPYSTTLPKEYEDIIHSAINSGLHIANPLHGSLPQSIIDHAADKGVEIYNFRHRTQSYPKGNGEKRSGLRLLTVGTDCAIGKKFTAVSLWRSLTELNQKATFRSTGQTGFLISGSGINNDTIEADFLSGAAEWLSPANDVDHWDLIEGQGALSHPSFGAGSLSLIHGSQPDLVVLCTELGRKTQRGVQRAPLNPVDEVQAVLHMGRRTNPKIKLGAVSLMTKDMSEEDIQGYTKFLKEEFNVPVFDPKIKGADYEAFLQRMIAMSEEARFNAERGV